MANLGIHTRFPHSRQPEERIGASKDEPQLSMMRDWTDRCSILHSSLCLFGWHS
jgi:hypothetical protein